MSKYIVVWAEPDELSPNRHRKLFESFIAAQWFAKELKKRYNWVICTESKNLED